MPHCIIEYSSDLHTIVKPDQLIGAVFAGALNSKLFEAYDIKTRALCFDNYQTGPVKNAFIHVVVKILSGRTAEQRSILSGLVLTELKSFDFVSTSLTVEVVEIERSSYAKVLM
ncbi:5-carboxymethyl-2-hydroxymuconate Delta-isomerase [Psychromonas ossibalaenae]|uniref:5-carboxymethyl-2-hydroxymuconate Delta-isomerase n=1 Tax=Psychromonas ossibalaenae TaxID=444922 RepID=UPI000371F21C|nr:5-carboxymethyl-2-hydroxymuconate Delta-isomerase [Psychromonas ossibalaenae]